MASGANLIGKSPVRMLLVGYPGAGKTGALAALANVGYKLRVLDFEGNFDPLLNFMDERALANIDIQTFQDKMMQGQKSIEPAGIPTAFNDALKAMKQWKYEEDGETVDLGASSTWGPDTVVVVDSMTAMAETARRRAMKMLNKTPTNMTSSVWGLAVDDFLNALKIMGAQKNRYHLIVLGHLQMIGAEDFIKQGDDDAVREQKTEAIRANMIPTRLFPKAVTKNQSQVIHKEFPSMVLAQRKVKHGKTVRVLTTKAGEELDLKFPAKSAPDEVPLETGLATLFEALGQKAPGL